METARRVAKRAIRRFKQDEGFEPYITEVDVDGDRIKVFIGDRSGQRWYDRPVTPGRWSEEGGQERPFVRDRMVQPGDRVLECGAHHGFFTVLFTRWVTERGRVISLEANPQNAEIARRTIGLNDVTNVEIRNVAVGPLNGWTRVPLVSNSSVNESAGALRRTVERFLEPSARVEMVPIDDFVDFAPTLLSIDIEGYEVAALRGGRAVLSSRPKIVIEVHPRSILRYGDSFSELVDTLEPLDYRFFVRWPDSTIEETDRLGDIAEPVEGLRVEKLHLMALPR